MKVVLAGPPHSGKSCLRFGLKEAIKDIPESPYPLVITACPDGEGSWFQETAENDADLAAQLKAAYKSSFTDERTEIMARWVEDCSLPFSIVDIGGIPDARNERICAHATHAILVGGATDGLQQWRDFCDQLSLQIIAEIYSDYNGMSDKRPLRGKDGVYRGSVHHLERGDLSIRQRPTVIEMAKILVTMVTTERREHDGL